MFKKKVKIFERKTYEKRENKNSNFYISVQALKVFLNYC